MASPRIRAAASCVLAALVMLLLAEPAAAQGAVTPAFGNGELTLVGEDYLPGERVEIVVRTGGLSHHVTAMADARGRFRLETGLLVPPRSSVEIEARDEQGVTQATITSAPGAQSGPGGGMPLPPAPITGDSPAPPSSPDQMPTDPCLQPEW